jgi:hypothetical protein
VISINRPCVSREIRTLRMCPVPLSFCFMIYLSYLNRLQKSGEFLNIKREFFTPTLKCPCGNLLHEAKSLWEACGPSASQDVPRLLCNQKIHYRVCGSHWHSPETEEFTQRSRTLFFKFLILSPYLYLSTRKVLSFLGFQTKILYELLNPMRPISAAHLTVLNFIAPIRQEKSKIMSLHVMCT